MAAIFGIETPCHDTPRRQPRPEQETLASKKRHHSHPQREHPSSIAKKSKEDHHSRRRTPSPRSKGCSQSSSPRPTDHLRHIGGVTALHHLPSIATKRKNPGVPYLGRNWKLPVGLENPPLLGTYDGTSDPDEHIENIDALLDYRGVPSPIKYRLFLTALCKGAMTWYKSLLDETITSWKASVEYFLGISLLHTDIPSPKSLWRPSSR